MAGRARRRATSRTAITSRSLRWTSIISTATRTSPAAVVGFNLHFHTLGQGRADRQIRPRQVDRCVRGAQIDAWRPRPNHIRFPLANVNATGDLRRDHQSRKRIADPGRTRDADGQDVPRILDAGGAVVGAQGRRRPDAASSCSARNLIMFRDTFGPRWRHGSSLPASLRQPVLRPQRGERHPLHLSRLEIRRRRQLPRPAQPAAASGLQGQGQGQGLQGHRAQRRDLGLYGQPRQGAAAADVRGDLDAGIGGAARHRAARMQLPSGARGRYRHLAFRLPACRRARLSRI